MPNDERTLLESRRFTVVEKAVTRPDGQAASCQYVRHPGSVAILPLLDDGRVCLIRSRRLTVNQTLIEVPAGTREPDADRCGGRALALLRGVKEDASPNSIPAHAPAG